MSAEEAVEGKARRPTSAATAAAEVAVAAVAEVEADDGTFGSPR